MGEKIQAWKSDDGLLFESESEMIEHEYTTKLADDIRELVVDKLFSHGVTKGELAETITENWDKFLEIMYRNEKPRAFTKEQLSNLEKLGIWGSKDGHFTLIKEMGNNHLQNAYRIANNETRPGYEVYRTTLLAELTNRKLRTEVKTDESHQG